MTRFSIVILGLSITSSWGNGHATTYRGLVRELSRRGHDVLFLERDVPWYAANRDMPSPPFGRCALYGGVEELESEWSSAVREADLVIVGSYVPQGVQVGEWVQRTAGGASAFYDIDTPVTLAKLAGGDYEYLCPELIPGYDMYLSFTGGPTLARLENEFGSPMARPLYCSVDPDLYYPEELEAKWKFGYLGTYSPDRQPGVEALLLGPARALPRERFVVAGPQFPEIIRWPQNVERIEHLPPHEHRRFYTTQDFTLNITRADMVRAGWSPSVRLFEAAACGTPVITDRWEGMEEFFEPGKEILIADGGEDALKHLQIGEEARQEMGRRARERVLSQHTAAHRARELEDYLGQHLKESSPRRRAGLQTYPEETTHATSFREIT